MKLSILLVATLSLSAIARPGSEPGTASCFGDGSGTPCPCLNSGDPGEGCMHSSGHGMVISGSGSTSILADDLVLYADQCPPVNTGIFYVGTESVSNQLFDGIQCASGNVRRFRAQSQTDGSASDTDFGAQSGGSYFFPGETYHFQY